MTEQQRAFNRHIGSHLREHRKLTGHSHKELADLSDVAVITIVQYERGDIHIKMDKLCRLADQMNVHVDYFFRNSPGA